MKGSGPHGRIVRADVEGAQPGAAKPAAAAVAAAAAAPAAAKPAGRDAHGHGGRDGDEDVCRPALSRKWRWTACAAPIAARLTEAKQTIPHFYLRRDVRLDALMAFRETLNKQLEGARA